MSNEINYNQYSDILRYIITEIKSTRVTIAHRVNSAVMQMYWNIGERLSVEKLEKGYGGSVVKRLSADLKQEFPDTTGFSPRNLWNMKNFYEFYALADVKVQRSVALLCQPKHKTHRNFSCSTSYEVKNLLFPEIPVANQPKDV